MLAAMSMVVSTAASAGESPWRERGDACPGALRLHAADDGALARVRVPGGVLSAAQADALGDAARELGDGALGLTSRGNVQLRGLPAGAGGRLAELLAAAGLLPAPDHERVRNVVASPLAGLDGAGYGDLRPLLRELDRLLCASGPARGLSGRFLFALDDGRGDTAALGADVTLLTLPDGGALLRPGAEAGALRVPGALAARAALLAAEVFLEAAAGAPGRAWRVAELDLEPGVLARTVAERLGAAEPAAFPLLPGAGGPPPGAVPGPGGTAALSVLAPLGSPTAAAWRLLAGAARRDGTGELRLTPWRGVVLPGFRAAAAPAALAELAGAGLITGPGSPWYGVGACAGRPGCAKSLADVRADAGAAATAAGGAAPGRVLPVYWSGCERRCGRPAGDRVDVVALAEGGYRVSAVVAGHARDSGRAAGPDDLAATVAAARTTPVNGPGAVTR
jgi:precorrin-3B synthase